MNATSILLEAIAEARQPAKAMTAAEITDARLDVISRAREVLERAVSEHDAWRGRGSLFPVTAAMTDLRYALRYWDLAVSEDEKDAAVRNVGYWSGQVVAAFEEVMGPEAAAYVSGTEGGEQ